MAYTAFSVGFPGSADIQFAQRYCVEYGIPHQIVYLNREDIVRDVLPTIDAVETFEAINIMDGCVISPLFRAVHEAGIKVALMGDGSDELLAGYDFFKTYQDPDYLMTYRLFNLYRTDLQRIDRSSMRYGVTVRFPFLDQEFVSFAYHVPMTLKLRNNVEKWILRAALEGELPDYILHRPKVRMPDGSGLKYTLIEFARQQKTEGISQLLATRLQLNDAEETYFLEQYLKLGYPEPQERYKKVGLDYSPNGYFDFIT